MSGCCSTNTEPYALRVMGDSMWPEFEDGSIIIVDPGGLLQSGSFVVVDHREDVTFRQYIEHNGNRYLVPVNDIYPSIELNEPFVIRGVVIQKNFRRQRIHYEFNGKRVSR